METMPSVGESDRKRIAESIQAWWDRMPGCTDKWLSAILRSCEYEPVAAVVRQRENQFMSVNQWRFLRLRILVNKARFDAD